MRSVAVVLSCLVLWCTAASSAEPPIVTDAWVRATPPGVTTAAAYLTLTSVDGDDALVAAETTAARTVELHASTMANGMHHMHALESIPLAKGTPVALAPGGTHIMLIGIAAALRPGDTVPLRLRFASGVELELGVPVRDGRDTAAHH